MIGVVGASFTAEYLGRGLYENTIGRLSEWIGGGTNSVEDRFLTEMARDYANFIHETPWYAFPFRKKLAEFSTLPRASQGSVFRSFERRCEGFVELGFKTAWAWLIGLGTAAAYEPEDMAVQVALAEPAPNLKLGSRVRRLNEKLLVVPRYQAFTEILPGLIRQGIKPVSVAGNNRIVVSLRAPLEWKPEAEGLLNQHRLLAEPDRKRVVVETEITRLESAIAAWDAEQVRIEHLYDY